MRFRESETEGGWCQFDLTFSESGVEKAPVPTEAPGAAMESASKGLFERAKDWFSKTWQATGLSDYVSIEAVKNLGAVADYLGWLGVPLPGNALLRGLLTALPSKLTPEAIATALAQATALVAGAKPVAKALVGLDILRRFRIPLPKDLLKTFGVRPGGSAATGLYLGAQLELHVGLRAAGVPLTPDQAQVEANAAALTALVQQLALAALPTPIAEVPLDSYEELAALRASVLLAFDDVEAAAPDGVFNALGELRAAVMREFTERGTTLRPLRRYVTITPQAAPVLAQRLYQDLDRADELVARTRAVHPGFLPLSGRVAAS
jgi:hypothetical protein